jgi:murein DD-endopeptidase MepM/ murein hydrolase activator NlpD
MAKRYRICLMTEGEGTPKIRSFSASAFWPRFLTFTFVFFCSALVIYAAYAYRTLSGVNDQSLELDVLKSQNAAKDGQLMAISERLEDLDRKFESLAEREKNLSLLTKDFNQELGLPETATLEAIWPALTKTVAWTWGGSEAQGGLPSTAAEQEYDWRSPSEVVRAIHNELDRLERNSAEVELALSELSSALEGSKTLLSATPTILPLTKVKISSGFGYRASPFGRGADMHQGLDMPAPVGTSVYAPASGTVLTSDWSGNGYGLMVTLDHGFGLTTRYAHLSESLVTIGQTVERGDLIAKVGNTGRSTGPHLHFETVLGGVPVDPLIFTRTALARQEASN